MRDSAILAEVSVGSSWHKAVATTHSAPRIFLMSWCFSGQSSVPSRCDARSYRDPASSAKTSTHKTSRLKSAWVDETFVP